MQATFTRDFSLTSAVQDGLPKLALLDGRVPCTNGWFARNAVVQTDYRTNFSVLACDKTFYQDSSAEEPYNLPLVPGIPSVRVLVLPNGDVWRGSSDCWVALSGDKIIGITVNIQTGELLAFVGPHSRISMADSDRISAVKKVLMQVEAQARSGSFAADKTISLASLYGDPNLVAPSVYPPIRNLYVEGNTIVVGLTARVQNKRNLWIKLTSGLDVLSAERDDGPSPDASLARPASRKSISAPDDTLIR